MHLHAKRSMDAGDDDDSQDRKASDQQERKEKRRKERRGSRVKQATSAPENKENELKRLGWRHKDRCHFARRTRGSAAVTCRRTQARDQRRRLEWQDRITLAGKETEITFQKDLRLEAGFEGRERQAIESRGEREGKRERGDLGWRHPSTCTRAADE